MNAQLGRMLILAALAFASSGAVVGFAAGRTGSDTAYAWTRRLALLFSGALILANLVMVQALLQHDFSVSYVAHVGSIHTPVHITIVSLWSSLEGSILFWGFVLGGYLVAFTWWGWNKHRDLMPYSLATAMAVGLFFAFLIAGPANPFLDTPERLLRQAQATGGPGPNPLLQNHILMVVHPPALYLGFVGMTIPFAMGVSALLRGRLGAGWTQPIRSWMLVPWGWLTGGIILGGWWSYEVLGWGGYWAWDPVENASLLPWLTGAAFLHSSMVQERRGILKGWTLILLLTTFILTLIATFMTRSGVFNSVHAFSQSPIGPVFLGFIALTFIVSILLLAGRSHLLAPDGVIQTPASREGSFLLNNLLLVAFTFTVFVGTIFPILAEAVRGVKVSVGEPYFKQLTVPLGVGLVFLMGLGPALPWGRVTGREAVARITPPVVVGVTATIAFAAGGVRDFWPAITVFVSGFAAAVSLRVLYAPVRALKSKGGRGWGDAMLTSVLRGHRRVGAHIVHLGVAMAAVSIAISSAYVVSSETVLQRGESVELGDYTLTFQGSRVEQKPNLLAQIAEVGIKQGGRDLGVLTPAMNKYPGQMSPIGTPAVRSTAAGDLYLSVMNLDLASGTLGLRALVNPAVPWLWGAGGLMVLGCLVALAPLGRRKGRNS